MGEGRTDAGQSATDIGLQKGANTECSILALVRLSRKRVGTRGVSSQEEGLAAVDVA